MSDKQLSSGMEKFMEKHQERDRLPKNMRPDWTAMCENCGASPIVPETGLCGPCTFGEADTADGNW
jgi:hypothetical protein